MRKEIIRLTALAMVSFMACSAPGVTAFAGESEMPAAEEDADEENYDTGDASKDDPRNGDDIGENELLVVSFGTSYNDSRCATIGGIEEALEEAFPDLGVRRAFTSQIIIDHIARRDGEIIDNVSEALERAADNGVKNLVVLKARKTCSALRTSLRKRLPLTTTAIPRSSSWDTGRKPIPTASMRKCRMS